MEKVNSLLKQAVEIIEKVSQDSRTELKIRLAAQVFLKRLPETMKEVSEELDKSKSIA